MTDETNRAAPTDVPTETFERLAARKADPRTASSDFGPGGAPALGVLHLLRSGWAIFRARPGLSLAAVLVLILTVVAYFRFLLPGIGNAHGGAERFMRHHPGLLALSLFLFQLVLNYLVVGLFMLLLRVRRGRGSMADLFLPFRRFLNLLLTGALLMSATSLGFLLLVIPGLVVVFGLYFSIPLAIETRLGPIAALRASWRLTHGYKGQLFLYFLTTLATFLLCGIAATICLSIGTQLLPFPAAQIVLVAAFFLCAYVIPQLVFLGGWATAYDELLDHRPVAVAPEREVADMEARA